MIEKTTEDIIVSGEITIGFTTDNLTYLNLNYLRYTGGALNLDMVIP